MKNTIQAIGCAALVLSCTENGDSPRADWKVEMLAENIWLAKWIRRPTSAPIHFRVSGQAEAKMSVS